MNEDIPFNRKAPAAGAIENLSNGLRRIVAPNAGPFTFSGTCSYIVGRGKVAVVDPGPRDPSHVAALTAAIAGEAVDAIVVTHTHRDHSGAAPLLAEVTGARTYGAGPHRSARPLRQGEINALDAGADHDFIPDVILRENDVVECGDWRLIAIATPGHCANHLAFALEPDNVLLSGDHVMGWSTSIVAPPDGSMGDYLTSLRKLLGRPETRYWPGHGGPVEDPQRFVRSLIGHRRMRETAILKALAQGPQAIAPLTAKVYAGLQPALLGAASLNLYAHLEDLVERRQVATEGEPSLQGTYWLL